MCHLLTQQKAHLSKKNMKLGNTVNVNLPPPLTCEGLPCLKEGCYAMKAWRQWPSVRFAWTDNYLMIKNDMSTWFTSIVDYLQRSKRKWFRWHAAGEIVNQEYFRHMVLVALSCPETKFCVFTKRYDLDLFHSATNLEVIPSSWPRLKFPANFLKNRGFSVAWMDDKQDTRRIKELSWSLHHCPGKCEDCRVCWNASYLGLDILFKKH